MPFYVCCHHCYSQVWNLYIIYRVVLRRFPNREVSILSLRLVYRCATITLLSTTICKKLKLNLPTDFTLESAAYSRPIPCRFLLRALRVIHVYRCFKILTWWRNRTSLPLIRWLATITPHRTLSYLQKNWSPRRGLNSRPFPYRGNILSLNYTGNF